MAVAKALKDLVHENSLGVSKTLRDWTRHTRGYKGSDGDTTQLEDLRDRDVVQDGNIFKHNHWSRAAQVVEGSVFVLAFLPSCLIFVVKLPKLLWQNYASFEQMDKLDAWVDTLIIHKAKATHWMRERNVFLIKKGDSGAIFFLRYAGAAIPMALAWLADLFIVPTLNIVHGIRHLQGKAHNAVSPEETMIRAWMDKTQFNDNKLSLAILEQKDDEKVVALLHRARIMRRTTHKNLPRLDAIINQLELQHLKQPIITQGKVTINFAKSIHRIFAKMKDCIISITPNGDQKWRVSYQFNLAKSSRTSSADYNTKEANFAMNWKAQAALVARRLKTTVTNDDAILLNDKTMHDAFVASLPTWTAVEPEDAPGATLDKDSLHLRIN